MAVLFVDPNAFSLNFKKEKKNKRFSSVRSSFPVWIYERHCDNENITRAKRAHFRGDKKKL